MATVTGSQLDPIINNASAMTADASGNVTGDANSNIIVGNNADNHLHAGAGDDTVITGAGDDMIMLGAGNDTVFINGAGTKTVNGGPQDTPVNGQFHGEGNDHFVIHDDGAGSNTTFTGLNIGDRLSITVADVDGGGLVHGADFTLSGENGDITGAGAFLKVELPNGTSFTLDGVPVDAFSNGTMNIDAVDNGDGTWCIELTGADV